MDQQFPTVFSVPSQLLNFLSRVRIDKTLEMSFYDQTCKLADAESSYTYCSFSFFLVASPRN